MRATLVLLILFLWCHSSVSASTFIFRSGKSIQGEIRYEDAATIRILEQSGLEMTLRKSELNLDATRAANLQKQSELKPSALPEQANQTTQRASIIPSKVFTNRDIRGTKKSAFASPVPESKQAWQKAVASLEREFVRLQGACRGAGTGPNLSKIRKSHTYNVNGKQVRVTGYWADPENIEAARRICERAIETEEALESARRGYQDFLNTQNSDNALTGR